MAILGLDLWLIVETVLSLGRPRRERQAAEVAPKIAYYRQRAEQKPPESASRPCEASGGFCGAAEP